MATLGFCCCALPFFSCSEWGLFFLQCTSFSLRWLLLLQSTGSKRGLHHLWHAGLVAPRHLGSSQTRYQTKVPSIVRWILSHWTIREAPFFTILAPGSGYQFLQWVKKSVQSIKEKLAGCSERNPHIRENLKKECPHNW